MPQITVRCVWRFFAEDDFYEAVRLCRILECLLWPEFLDHYDDDGYELLSVIIGAEDERFLFNYGNMLNLYSGVECCACDIIDRPLDLASQGSVDVILNNTRFRTGVIEPLVNGICVRNRAVRHDPILWFQAEWAHNWMETLNVEALMSLTQEPRLVVFYTIRSEFRRLSQIKKDPRLLSIKFYFKLVKSPGFHRWFENIKSTLPFEYMLLLADYNERFGGGITPDFAAIQAYPQLTPDTLDTFLQAIAWTP